LEATDEILEHHAFVGDESEMKKHPLVHVTEEFLKTHYQSLPYSKTHSSTPISSSAATAGGVACVEGSSCSIDSSIINTPEKQVFHVCMISLSGGIVIIIIIFYMVSIISPLTLLL
jgi:hypothetical protein